MQTILGANGTIGSVLAKELRAYTDRIRLVSRSPKKVNDTDELFPADLLQPGMVDKAVEGCNVAYLTAGLEYRLKTWQIQWPLIMKNVIAACKKHKTKLVFFDNIYMYHPDKLSLMTEETAISPASEKGKVRAEIAQMVLNEIKTGKLEALIARAADFYGPNITNSVYNEVVIKKLKAGKKANWFCSISHLHSFTFTPDAALATALLGNTVNAFNQVWHLPTAAPITGKEWIEKVAKELGVEPKTQVASKFMIKMLGLFNPVMKEFVEMLYQWDRDYNFDSSKFETVFKMKPTPIDEGIKKAVQAG